MGRTAEPKEKELFELNTKTSFIVLDLIKIFALLSRSHRHDIKEILHLVVGN